MNVGQGGSGFEPRRKGRRILIGLIANGLPLFLVIYGLKCIVAQRGQLTEPGKYVMGSFFLARVKGMASVMTGLGDISLGLFAYLLGVVRPKERCSTMWRVMRALLQWGSLGATFFLWHTAHNLRLGAT